MNLLGKAITWLVKAIVGKAARDLTDDTDPVPLTRRSVELEWNQRHAGRAPTAAELLERQKRNEIPPPKQQK